MDTTGQANDCLSERLIGVQQRMRAAWRGAKDPGVCATLLAVSKYATLEQMAVLYRLGQRDFAENYVQSLRTRLSVWDNPSTNWHFIGQLQRNKLGWLAKHAHWVHSLDREVVAHDLSRHRCEVGTVPLNVCLQVCLDHKNGLRGGIALQAAEALAKYVLSCPGLCLKGLMFVPEPGLNQSVLRQQFQTVYQFWLALKQQGFLVDTLSMGMSLDFELAIEEGATLIRVGSAIFGQGTGG